MIVKIDGQHSHIFAGASVPACGRFRGQVFPNSFCAARGPTVEFQ